jgi:hypothetical protein
LTHGYSVTHRSVNVHAGGVAYDAQAQPGDSGEVRAMGAAVEPGDMDESPRFGDLLRRLRTDHGWSLRDLVFRLTNELTVM